MHLWGESYRSDRFVLDPTFWSTSLTAAAIGTLGLWMGYGFLCETVHDKAYDAGAFAAMRKLRSAALATFGALSLWLWGIVGAWGSYESGFHNSAFVDAVLMTAGSIVGIGLCLVFLPLLLGAIPPDESGVTRFNRVHERRELWLENLVFVTEPRWAFSLLGIGIVLLTIVAFDYRSPPSPLLFFWTRSGIAGPIAFSIAGAGGILILRDWRGFFACALPPAFAATVGAWIAYRTHLTVLDAPFADYIFLRAWQLIAAGTITGAGLAYAICARIAAYRAFDASLQEADAKALHEVAPPLIAITLVVVVSNPVSPIVPVALISCLSGLLLTPAILAALETVFPKLKSVEELYGKKRAEPG